MFLLGFSCQVNDKGYFIFNDVVFDYVKSGCIVYDFLLCMIDDKLGCNCFDYVVFYIDVGRNSYVFGNVFYYQVVCDGMSGIWFIWSWFYLGDFKGSSRVGVNVEEIIIFQVFFQVLVFFWVFYICICNGIYVYYKFVVCQVFFFDVELAFFQLDIVCV